MSGRNETPLFYEDAPHLAGHQNKMPGKIPGILIENPQKYEWK